MAESVKQKLGFVVAALMLVTALGVLNLGTPAGAQSDSCAPDGGGGGGGGTASPSPTESEEPFPPPLPPIIPEESETSPSPTNTQGGARECDSKISLNYNGPTRSNPTRRQFSGRVQSDEDACESGRKVVLKKDRRTGRDRTVDATVTNRRGSYKIPVKRANGKYYAQTPQEKVASQNGRVTCGAARSKTIKV